MDSVTTRGNVAPNFFLSPHQQDLLLAALNSNKPPLTDVQREATATNTSAGTQILLNETHLIQAPDSGTLGGLDDSPFIDYDYDFDTDTGFDFDYGNISQGQMIGNLPGAPLDGDVDTHDKRSHPDDEGNEEGGGKRREGDDKFSKKPGRKPLTSEPTTKRKAQNRAAQRAFRERKEKHLKDLETKVQDLEKASEAANHENSILRAQIERMSVELQEYKKKLSLGVNSRSPPLNQLPHLNGVSNPNDVNFQFEFPKFGKLPGPSVPNISKVGSSSAASPPTPVYRTSSSSSNGNVSPLDKSQHSKISNGASTNNNSLPENTQTFPQLDGTDISDFSTLFPPVSHDGISSDSLVTFSSSGSRSSEDSIHRQNSTSQSTSYSSPSASSNVGSNAGLSSSCGTSPEPFVQSPSTFKPNDNILSTIGEEYPAGISEGEKTFREKLRMACDNAEDPVLCTPSENTGNSGFLDASSFDINGIDWLAQQNNNQFDPELFGDYREPQNNILSGGLYDDSFFADAFPIPDFSSPFNLAPSPASKKDLVTEIDQKPNEEVVPGEYRKTLLTCNTMWEKIQSCPKVQSGDIDMDSLCTQLQQKAKCSGDGPVINEKDFHDVINSVLKMPS